MSQTTDLPSYRRPPVNEVVCGVQFEELPSFSSVHFGKFWRHVKDDYPRTEDHEPLVQVFEQPEGARAKDEVIQLTLPPFRRVFYVSDNDNYLLQLQSSRFLANWRKRRDHDQYPRFTAAFTRFVRGWETFLAFVGEEKLGAPQVNQYELTYINHIEEATQKFPAGIQEHLRFFDWPDKMMLLPSPRGANVRLQFPLPDGRGMLHATVAHGTRPSDRKGIMLLDLTARGPARNDCSDMKAWFEVAHEWIVKGFTDLTSEDAHRRWEREQ